MNKKARQLPPPRQVPSSQNEKLTATNLARSAASVTRSLSQVSRVWRGEKGEVKKVNHKIRESDLRYMLLGQIFDKNAKNDHINWFETLKSVKK